MLKYLVQVTGDLLSTGILLGLAFAFAQVMWSKTGKRSVYIGLLAGLVLAAAMAFMKTTTNIVDTPLWNTRIAVMTAVAFVVLAVFCIPPIRSRLGRVADIIGNVGMAAFVAFRLFFNLPVVIAYPANFTTQGNGLASTEFLFRFIGLVLGIVLIIVVVVSVAKVARAVGGRSSGALFFVGALALTCSEVMTGLQAMMVRYVIGRTAFTFNLVKHDDSPLFMYLMVALAAIAVVIIIVRSMRVNEPYDNPAQRRKIRAKWRSRRRWSAAVLVCLILAACNLTVVDAYASREVELSPSEDCEMRADAMYIPFEQVEDGSLHRFTYTTDSGRGVRFIVIKKPNSQAYGIGLDACEICGETGYYERNGQVVCKLCDVVMNINTIGFKGGCNPIPIDYRIENGYIIVPYETLIEHESIFKK